MRTNCCRFNVINIPLEDCLDSLRNREKSGFRVGLLGASVGSSRDIISA